MLLTRRDLFSRLDMGYPGLEEVNASVERGNWRKAGGELLAYYRGEREGRCLASRDTSGPEALPSMPWGAAADPDQLWKNTPAKVVAGYLYSLGRIFDFSRSENIHWPFHYQSMLDGNSEGPRAEALMLLHRMCWLRPLDLAYLTGDETTKRQAAERFESLIKSWWAQPSDETYNQWCLTTACRLGSPRTHSGLIFSWYTFLDSPHVSDEFQLKLLRDIFRQADAITERGAGPRCWEMPVGAATGYASMLFPECRRARAWRQKSSELFSHWLLSESRADGTYDRHGFCPHYQGAFCDPLVFAADAAELGYTDVILPEAEQALGRAMNWIANVQKPDNTVPQINASDIQGFGPWLNIAARRFNRPDWRHTATAGKEGRAPGHTSMVLPDAGAFILRDGFQRDSLYACFHNGNYECKERSSLALDLYAFGRTLITGCGRYQYYTPEWYKYFTTTGYNTLMVDGSLQQEWEASGLFRTKGLAKNNWYFGTDVDFAWGTHPSGFESAPAVRHQRGLLLVKGEYWVVIDSVTGPGAHELSLRWLLTPSTTFIESGGLIVHTRNTDANVRIVPLVPQEARLQIWEGSREPLRGWFSPDHGVMIPSPQLEYTWRVGLPALAATLIVPYRGAVPRIHADMAVEAQGRSALTIRRGENQRDVLHIDLGGSGTVRFERQRGKNTCRTDLIG